MPAARPPIPSAVGPKASCDEEGCGGARLESRHCLEHLTTSEFDAAAIRLRNGHQLEARCTTISTERLRTLLEALSDDGGRPVLHAADFRGATFSGDAPFGHTRFEGDADFTGTTFDGEAQFGEPTFAGYAKFDDASFSNHAVFVGATFAGGASFDRTRFNSWAIFSESTFDDFTSFDGAIFKSDALFSGAVFAEGIYFRRAMFCTDASFVNASFERARRLGPVVVGRRLVLDGCTFDARVTIEVAATVISARDATFAAGAHLRVRWAEVALDDADFARPSTISGALTWRQSSDLTAACIVDARRIQLEPRPRLITLRGAYVAGLSVADIDLRACRFFGAHGLESLRIESGCRWPSSPQTRRHVGRATIAEEHNLRGVAWDGGTTRAPDWLEGRDGDQPLGPGQIAALYRALRKAREDNKDQAGATHLYYGEMEMRRLRAVSRGEVDAVLTSYWLISGYGISARRALVTLFVVVVGFSLALWRWGFAPTPEYLRALLYSIESTSSLFRVPNASGLEITYAGEFMQIALRILGPLLIGLALLALRARVKR